jgi:hypothetical protein
MYCHSILPLTSCRATLQGHVAQDSMVLLRIVQGQCSGMHRSWKWARLSLALNAGWVVLGY